MGQTSVELALLWITQRANLSECNCYYGTEDEEQIISKFQSQTGWMMQIYLFPGTKSIGFLLGMSEGSSITIRTTTSVGSNIPRFA